MGRTKGAYKSDPPETPNDSLLDEMWTKLEITLNEWIIDTLPTVVKDLLKAHVVKAVDEYVSSTKFASGSLSESLKFDIDELKATVQVRPQRRSPRLKPTTCDSSIKLTIWNSTRDGLMSVSSEFLNLIIMKTRTIWQSYSFRANWEFNCHRPTLVAPTVLAKDQRRNPDRSS